MNLTSWLKLQIVYGVAGISFNLVSYLRIKYGLEGLTNTNPIQGIAVMVPIHLAVWAAHKGYTKSFITINSALAPLLIYAGVIQHFSSNGNLSWATMLTSPLVLAVAINCFGATVMTMSVIAIRQTNQTVEPL